MNCKGCGVIPYHDILLTRKLPKTNYNIKKRKSDQANYPDVKTAKTPKTTAKITYKMQQINNPKNIKEDPKTTASKILEEASELYQQIHPDQASLLEMIMKIKNLHTKKDIINEVRQSQQKQLNKTAVNIAYGMRTSINTSREIIMQNTHESKKEAIQRSIGIARAGNKLENII